jgi:hypothetical protein
VRFKAMRGGTPAGVLAFLLGMVVAAPAQQPPVQQLPAQQKPAATPPVPPLPTPPSDPSARLFAGDSGVIFNLVKPDKTADFEAVLKRVQDALARSADDKRKQQAAGWRVFRSPDPGPGGNVLYVFWFDPAVKNEDYSITKILQEAFPTEVQDLYAKLIACYPDQGGQSLLNLELRLNMAPNAPGK